MTSNLLIFFVLPLATIVFSIVLEKILSNPLLVSLVVFSVYLIISFVISANIGLAELIIISIIYSIISFITAWITETVNKIKKITNHSRTNNFHKIENNVCENNSEYPINYINNILGIDSSKYIR